MKPTMQDGKHLMVDAYGCDPERLWDAWLIRITLLKITKEVGLRPLSEPMLYTVTKEEARTADGEGITGAIIFYESHFTFHTFPSNGYFSADIYSCGDFDHGAVEGWIRKAFRAKSSDTTVIRRGARLHLEMEGLNRAEG